MQEKATVVDTSSVHSCSKALLITTVLALSACRHADVAVFVRFAHERKPVAGVAQEKRLKQTAHNITACTLCSTEYGNKM